MYRIEPKRLLWVLDHLVEGKIVNRIEVPERAKAFATQAIERMLDHVVPA